jgi:hypothetical protein
LLLSPASTLLSSPLFSLSQNSICFSTYLCPFC